MKTLFITPLIGIPKTEPPLGLMYIQACLDRAGYESKIMDLYDSYDEVRESIRTYNPDVIGIACFTTYRGSSFELARIAKEAKPDAKVVLGGAHSTFLWHQILENIPEVDIIVLGEGEITFTELIQTLEKNDSLKNVKGIAYRNRGKPVMTQARDLIANLDDLPFPSYRDIPLERYAIPTPPTVMTSEIKANLVASRGCPFGCSFCSTTRFWGRWRGRSPKNVVDELEWHYERGVKFFSFSDDTFTTDKERVIEICKEIVSRGLKIRWYTETRVDLVSKEMFEWMKKAGCYMIEFGIESGSPKMLKSYNKRVTRKQCIDAVKMAKTAGLETEVMLIVGGPGETWDTIQETKDFLDECKPDIVIISVLYIFPHTNIYKIAKEAGVISDAFWLSNKFSPPFTVEHDIKTLYKMRLSVIMHFELSRGVGSFVKYIIGQIRKTPGVVWDHLVNMI